MPNVNVDLLVPQGSFNEATSLQSIGTDGCSFCVGIIAVMNNGVKYCAHFDCNRLGNTQAQKDAIEAATLLALQTNINGVPIRMGACTTSNLNMSTGAIWAGIQAFFPQTIRHTTQGIYTTVAGTIGTVSGNDEVIGTQTLLNNNRANIVINT